MKKKINLSCVILAKDEEKNIERAIRSVSFCDEVVVIDDYSSDDTRKIAEGLGSRVFIKTLENNFAGQRNFGLSMAKGRWVLFLDADEEVSGLLAEEIIKRTSNSNIFEGYYFRRKDIIWGRKLNYGENGNIKLLRLAKKDAGKWMRKVHEIWEIAGEKDTLKNDLIHYPHQSLREFIEHVNRMSSLHAEENLREGKNSNLLKIILWPKMKFFNNYILRLGILDGIYGFVAAIMMSFHSYLAWSKLLILQKQKH